MRSPLGRAIGLGSAREGVQHWWAQRLTAVALVPLAVWFVVEVVALAGADRAALVAWLRQPAAAAAWVLLLLATFYHAALGVQVVVEDYVARDGLRLALVILTWLGAVLLAVLGIVSIVKLSLGG
jgi:succinate dehydrogenase membrane anchor subunit